MNLKAELERLEPSVVRSPWRGHEHVRGYGVFGLPLSSGHTLALRVFPINDFAPYVTVWHQTPDGSWSIYYDAPRADIACPRYYGAAARHVVPARIQLDWRGVAELMIRVDRPQLEWTVWMHEPLTFRLLNRMSAALPFWTWQHEPLLRMRAWMAGLMGMGSIALAGRMPSGHFGVLMPQRMYLIDRADVRLAGADLGTPVLVRANPTIGGMPLPARGVFAIGQAHWEIRDTTEYRETRAALEVSASKTPASMR